MFQRCGGTIPQNNVDMDSMQYAAGSNHKSFSPKMPPSDSPSACLVPWIIIGVKMKKRCNAGQYLHSRNKNDRANHVNEMEEDEDEEGEDEDEDVEDEEELAA